MPDVMERKLPDRLLVDRITVRRPVQSFVSGTKKPVFRYETVATNVKARFNPVSTKLDRNVIGQVPRKGYRLFVNEAVVNENDEVIWEATNRRFLVTQVRHLFGHHDEAEVTERD